MKQYTIIHFQGIDCYKQWVRAQQILLGMGYQWNNGEANWAGMDHYPQSNELHISILHHDNHPLIHFSEITRGMMTVMTKANPELFLGENEKADIITFNDFIDQYETTLNRPHQSDAIMPDFISIDSGEKPKEKNVFEKIAEDYATQIDKQREEIVERKRKDRAKRMLASLKKQHPFKL